MQAATGGVADDGVEVMCCEFSGGEFLEAAAQELGVGVVIMLALENGVLVPRLLPPVF